MRGRAAWSIMLASLSVLPLSCTAGSGKGFPGGSSVVFDSGVLDTAMFVDDSSVAEVGMVGPDTGVPDTAKPGTDSAPPDDAPTQPDTGPGKSCQGLPDGTPCGPAPNNCQDAPVCKSGGCATPANRPNGTVCVMAADACHTSGTCTSGSCGAAGTQPDGFNWSPGDATAMCCGGSEVHANTDSNCGVCGIGCNSSNGESCQLVGGHYFCAGCASSMPCWSRCCSQSFTPWSCAASDCAGNCDSTFCPPGTHCVAGDASSDYCSY